MIISQYDSPVVDGFGAVGVVVAPSGGDAHNCRAIFEEVIAGDDGVDGVGDVADDGTGITLKQRTRDNKD